MSEALPEAARADLLAGLDARQRVPTGLMAPFNQRSDNWQNGDAALDPALNRAASSVTDWPEEDLFGN